MTPQGSRNVAAGGASPHAADECNPWTMGVLIVPALKGRRDAAIPSFLRRVPLAARPPVPFGSLCPIPQELKGPDYPQRSVPQPARDRYTPPRIVNLVAASKPASRRSTKLRSLVVSDRQLKRFISDAHDDPAHDPRVLKKTGSFYCHYAWHASHYDCRRKNPLGHVRYSESVPGGNENAE